MLSGAELPHHTGAEPSPAAGQDLLAILLDPSSLGRTLLFQGSKPELQRFPKAVTAASRAANANLLRVDCTSDLPYSFGPARALSRPLLELCLEESRGIAADYRPEIVALFPELREEPLFADALPLGAIALGCTKRRLHADSEVIFRIIVAMSNIILRASEACPSFGGHALHVLVANVHRADRLTLRWLHHFAQRIARFPVRLVLSAAAGRDADRPWPARSPELDPGLAALVDADASRRRLVDEVLAALAPIRIERSPGHRQRESPAPSIPPASREQAELIFARTDLAPRSIRQPPGWGEEARSIAAALDAFAAGEVDRGLEASVSAAASAANDSTNIELSLFAAGQVLARATGPRAVTYRIGALQMIGLAQSFAGNQEAAVTALSRAYELARAPALRAQLCYYIGLVEAKRRSDLPAGRLWFERGLEAVAGLEGAHVVLERGWLHNGAAFAAWRARDPGLAEWHLEQAFGCARGAAEAQSLNLLLNLVNNASSLAESVGDIDRAIVAWQELKPWVDRRPDGPLAKSFHFREGWLAILKDDGPAAYGAYSRAAEIASAHRDAFHVVRIAPACAYAACLVGEHEAALEWYRRAATVAKASLLPIHFELRAVEFHVLLQAGRSLEAQRIARNALADHSPGSVDAAVWRSRLAALEESNASRKLRPHDAWLGIELPRPRSKLTTPFGAFAPAAG